VTPINLHRRCKAKKKNGEPCGAAATEGGLCFFHANPDKAAELGRIGGRSNGRHPAAGPPAQLPDLTSAAALRETIARLIVDVYSGTIHPRVAASLAPLINLQLRAIENAELEMQFEGFRQQLAEMGKKVEELAERASDNQAERPGKAKKDGAVSLVLNGIKPQSSNNGHSPRE
jgi:hypothetical protein